jgi:hypothetical protein
MRSGSQYVSPTEHDSETLIEPAAAIGDPPRKEKDWDGSDDPEPERQHEVREEAEDGKGRPEDFSLHVPIVRFTAGESKVSRVQLDGLNYPCDGSGRAGLVGHESAAHRGEEADGLAEDHIEYRAIVIVETGRETERKITVGEIGDIAAIVRSDHEADFSQALAIDFAKKVEFVSAAAGIAGKKRHENCLIVHARHRPMAQAEWSFRKRGEFARAEFYDFQCAFICDGAQSSGAHKAGARASKGCGLCRGFSC